MPPRSRSGGRRLDVQQMRELLRDGLMWCALGIVTKFPDQASHFELTGDDVLVDVELMPSREPVLCRLGAAAGGADGGVWRIPPVGTEVAVMIPGGELAADALIVATLSTGAVPAELDEETLVVKAPTIRIVTSDGDVIVTPAAGHKVLLGASSLGATDGVVHGSGIDPWTGQTYTVLANISGVVLAKK